MKSRIINEYLIQIFIFVFCITGMRNDLINLPIIGISYLMILFTEMQYPILFPI
jgi:type III secretory pathway component EscU